AGCNDCLFEYNELHNLALKEGDTGAFYGTRDWSTYGNVFRYNFIHHAQRANGFYCDDGNSGYVHHHNVVHNTICALKFGGGHHNIGRNNLLIKNEFQRIDDRGIARNYYLGTKYEDRLTRFKPFEEPWASYGKRLRERFGIQDDLWADILREEWHPEWPNGSKMIDNVSVQNGIFRSPPHGRVEVARNTVIEKVDDAGFYDYAQMDLRTDDRRVLEKIPVLNEIMPKMGLQPDSYRRAVPDRADVGGLSNRGEAADPWDEDQLLDRTVR
ncbi:MAG: right-handed parallel beta-helix repeat-containing protein, partial [Planctomycetota bacterium]